MTVLVGYTTSREGDAAFAAGLAEAGAHGERLVVVNSGHQGALVDAPLASSEQIRTLHERAAAEGVELEVRQPAHSDDLVHDVLDAAEAAEARRIVIGLRRRTAVGKLLHGQHRPADPPAVAAPG
jgi:hypothetical protein